MFTDYKWYEMFGKDQILANDKIVVCFCLKYAH